jgi:hypothetical protein
VGTKATFLAIVDHQGMIGIKAAMPARLTPEQPPLKVAAEESNHERDQHEDSVTIIGAGLGGLTQRAQRLDEIREAVIVPAGSKLTNSRHFGS